jgi:hypothetical protein
MSYTPPKVYISATPAGLRSVLEGVKEGLLSVGLVPVEIASFEPDWTKVASDLRQQIESCDALIHIAGTRYGAEPDPATLPPDTPRRSYAQMEYFIGGEVKEQRGEDFRMYVFVCPEDFPFDPAPGIEISEKWSLQDAHRNWIVKSPYFTGSPESADDMRQWAIGLRQQFPPPPPPPPPPEPPPILPPALPNAEGAGIPEGASYGAITMPADVVADAPRRSRVPLVLGVLALMAGVSLVAAFLMVRQLGLLDGKFAFTAKTESKAAPPPAAIPTPARKPPVAASPPPPMIAVEEKPAAPPLATPPPSAPASPQSAMSSAAPPTPAAAPPPAPAKAASRNAEVDLVRKATVAAHPASRLSVADIGSFYVDKPVYDGKTITREDVMRQVDQFRRNWDIQIYEVLEGPTVTAGEGTNQVTVQVKTRFVGMRKTAVRVSSLTMTSEYVVVVQADGSALIQSVREVARE